MCDAKIGFKKTFEEENTGYQVIPRSPNSQFS